MTSLTDIACSAELPSKMIVSDARAKTVYSDLAHARTSAIVAAAVTAKTTFDDSVNRAYAKIILNYITCIHVLPLFSSLNKSDGVQQLIHPVESVISDFFMSCDDCCTEGL